MVFCAHTAPSGTRGSAAAGQKLSPQLRKEFFLSAPPENPATALSRMHRYEDLASGAGSSAGSARPEVFSNWESSPKGAGELGITAASTCSPPSRAPSPGTPAPARRKRPRKQPGVRQGPTLTSALSRSPGTARPSPRLVGAQLTPLQRVGPALRAWASGSREAHLELKLCSCISWAHATQRDILAFIKQISQPVFSFALCVSPGEALACVKTHLLFPVPRGVIKYVTTLSTKLALLVPVNHHGNRTLFFIAPLPVAESHLVTPGFLVHGQPVAQGSPAPHHCKHHPASSPSPCWGITSSSSSHCHSSTAPASPSALLLHRCEGAGGRAVPGQPAGGHSPPRSAAAALLLRTQLCTQQLRTSRGDMSLRQPPAFSRLRLTRSLIQMAPFPHFSPFIPVATHETTLCPRLQPPPQRSLASQQEAAGVHPGGIPARGGLTCDLPSGPLLSVRARMTGS